MTGRTLLLIRHGESSANVAATAAEAGGAETIDVKARDADVPLSPLGEQQAAALRARLQDALPGDALIFSSPYRRALQTARLALGEERPPVVDERVRDRELGILDALTSIGVERRLPQEAARRRWVGKFYYRPPGGESWTDVALRVRHVVRDLGQLYPGLCVWVFTHQAVIMSFRLVLEGLDERTLLDVDRNEPLGNCSLTRYRDRGSASLELVTFADTRHLEASGVEETHEQTQEQTQEQAQEQKHAHEQRRR